LDELVAAGEVLDVAGGKGQPAYVSTRGFALAKERIIDALEAWHEAHPFRDGCARLELRKRLGLADGYLGLALDAALADGSIRAQAPGFALTNHRVELPPAADEFLSALLAQFEERAFNTPTWAQARDALAPAELAPEALEDLFKTLVDRGELVLVGDDLVFHRARYEQAVQLVRDTIEARGSLSAGDFKDLIESSRRYAIPLMEHFDKVGLTKRDGDVRVLAKG
ncbi:MAG: SelB C-terminal domain-containing protein, partial [Myxococcales bacterium]|nr:SelB C-terminal domain-containing protein [Myxococcales bacterium]